MAEPSKYELDAWEDIERFRGRPFTRAMHVVGDKAAQGVDIVAHRASDFTGEHERVREAQALLARGFSRAGEGALKARDAIPLDVRKQMAEWGHEAAGTLGRMVARASRIGLFPQRVVSRQRKLGHAVSTLADIRSLDLEQVDRVRGRGLAWYYPAAAALEGAGVPV